MYNECIQITRQFAFCPNAFRVDLYKNCTFGCKYCFANMDWAETKGVEEYDWDLADINKIRRLFYKALETDTESKDILVELIRHRVPIHCGGMSDPFQPREARYHLTEQLIDISNTYFYPIQFSTKTDRLSDEIMGKLNKDIHAFQVSIVGWNDEYVRKWECNTASAEKRLAFVRQLRDIGLWCGVRIQPIIDIVECEQLCYNLSGIASYVTLEHFKAIYDVHSTVQAFEELCDNKQDFVMEGGKLQVRRDVKIQNIKRLKKILNARGIKVGVGDNDLHYMSDSRCCCGTDCINDNFGNYMKYNLTYMCTGEFKDEWVPQMNPRKHINDQKYGLKIDCKQYVNDYVKLHADYLGDRKSAVEKQLFGSTRRRLF